MAEPSEDDTTRAGKHAAVALWSVRARLTSLLVVVGIVAAAIVLIVENRGGNAKAVTTANTSTPSGSASTAPAQGSDGLSGSGIGVTDGARTRPPSRATTAPTPINPLAPIVDTSSIPTTTTQAARASSSVPSTSPKPPVTSSAPPPPPSTPTPSPSPTKRCIPNTKICFPAK